VQRFLISLALSLITIAAAAQNPQPRTDKISPTVSPTFGGVDVTITGAHFDQQITCILPCPAKVSFGDIKVEPMRLTDSEIVVKSPAHPAGTVDITVTTAGGLSTTIQNAFTYTESPLTSAWEPVLLPVYIEGSTPGAGGSQWMTDFWLQNTGSTDLSIAPWPCLGEVCAGVFPLTKTLKAGESQHNLAVFSRIPSPLPGRLVYLSRPSADNAAMNLRVFDGARTVLDPGTEVPVVRERELLSRPVTLLNIPTSNNRLLLRIYDAVLVDARFRVRVLAQSETVNSQPIAEFELHATTTETGELRMSPAYAQQEIVPPPLAVAGPAAVLRVEVTPLTAGSRYWVFVSVTNNSTSHVTTVTPN
jgi:hypothetical protein